MFGTRRTTRRVFAIVVFLLILMLTSIYYYYWVKEHLIYQTRDASSGLVLIASCKWNGFSTYITYITVITPTGNMEINKVALCGGGDILSDCTMGNSRIVNLNFTQDKRAVRVDFAGRAPIEIPVYLESVGQF